MTQDLASPEPIDVDFDTEFPDQDHEHEPTVVKLTKNPPRSAQPENNDDGLLDLSDEATLDKLSSGGSCASAPKDKTSFPSRFSSLRFKQKRTTRRSGTKLFPASNRRVTIVASN